MGNCPCLELVLYDINVNKLCLMYTLKISLIVAPQVHPNGLFGIIEDKIILSHYSVVTMPKFNNVNNANQKGSIWAICRVMYVSGSAYVAHKRTLCPCYCHLDRKDTVNLYYSVR